MAGNEPEPPADTNSATHWSLRADKGNVRVVFSGDGGFVIRILFSFVLFLTFSISAGAELGAPTLRCKEILRDRLASQSEREYRWRRFFDGIQSSDLDNLSIQFYKHLSPQDRARFQGVRQPALFMRSYLEFMYSQNEVEPSRESLQAYRAHLQTHGAGVWRSEQLDRTLELIEKFSVWVEVEYDPHRL